MEFEKCLFLKTKSFRETIKKPLHQVTFSVSKSVGILALFARESENVCFNHTFFDGYSSFNILKDLFDNEEYIVINISLCKFFMFIPIITSDYRFILTNSNDLY